MKKRILSLLLALMFAMSLTVCAENGEGGAIKITSVEGYKGKTVILDVVIDENPGMIASVMTLSYDSDALTLPRVEDKGKLGENKHGDNLSADEYYIAWYNPLSESDFAFEGAVLSLTFEIAEDVDLGEYPVTLSVKEAYNTNLEPVEFTETAGEISVVEAPTCVIGDIDMDGVVKASDAVLLFRHSLNKGLYPVDYAEDMDFTKDNKINLLDAIKILRYSESPDLHPLEDEVNVFASGKVASIYVTSDEGYAGDEVNITVSLETEEEWSSLGLILDYNKKALSYKGISYGSVAEENVFGKEYVYDSEKAFIAVGLETPEALSGEIVTLTFEITGEAEKGYSVINPDSTKMDYGTFEVDTENGAVNVKKRNIVTVGFNSREFLYDGSEKELKIAGTIPEGGSVEYKNNKATDVGTYTATATVTAPGYEKRVFDATLTINPLKLTLSGVAAKDKYYDGTTDAEIREGELTGAVEGDDVYAVYPEKGTFASVNASTTAIKVTLDEIMLDGEDAGNYTLSQPTGLKAKINKAPVTVTADSFDLTIGEEIPELTYEITEGTVYEEDAITGKLTTKASTDAEGTFSITRGSLKASSNYVLTFVPGQITVLEKPVQEVSVAKLEEVYYGESPFALEVTLGTKVTDSEIVYLSSNENVAEISEDGVITVKNAGETEITVSKAGNDEYASFVYKQTLKVNKAKVIVNAVENQWKRVGAKEPELAYTHSDTLMDGDEFTGALSRKAGEDAGFYDILIGTLKINDNYEIIFNSAKFEIVDKLIQDVEITDFENKCYTDADFALGVSVGSDVTESEIIFASSDASVAEISEEGFITIKKAGETEISVNKAGNEDYKDFEYKKTLKITKAPVIINVTEGQSKKSGADDPAFAYTYEGTIKDGDAFTGALSRKSGEAIGFYDILIGTLAINENYDITFNSKKFEITEKTPQTIEVADIPALTYGDEPYTMIVTKDATSNLEAFSYATSDVNVVTVENGIITVVGAGTASITVTEPGNEEYASSTVTKAVSVAKKNVSLTAVDIESKTATIEGAVGADMLSIDFNKVKLTLGEANEESVNVTVDNLVLAGEKAANYNLVTESFVTTVTKDNLKTVTVTSDNGTVTGEGSYIKGTNVKLTAKAKYEHKIRRS